MDPSGASFETWYRQNHRRIRASVAAAGGFDPRSVEAADEAFARALERWDRVGKMRSPEAWTIKVSLNELRRSQRLHTHEEVGDGILAREPDLLVTPMPEVWAAVARLPDRQRLAVILRYVGDLTQEDVASAMGIRPGTAAASLSKARAALATDLAERGFGDEGVSHEAAC